MQIQNPRSPFPPRVRKVGVICPAGRPDNARLDLGLARMRAWGVEPVLCPLPEEPPRYFADTDAGRAQALNTFLADTTIDVIIAARGGFGCARLLDAIDFDLVKRRQMPLIGYSDVTALHAAFYGKEISTGFSGPVVAVDLARPAESATDRGALEFTVDSLRRAWTPGQKVTVPPGTRLDVLKPGRIVAPVFPATLSVLVSLLGTPHMPDLSGTVLVLEDVNEATYRIDRYLTQLEQADVLARAAGLVFASFKGGEDAEWLPDLFAEFAAKIDGPVAAGLPYGHCFPMVTVPVGRTCQFVCGDRTVERLTW